MQDVNGPADVQVLSQPARKRRPRVEAEPMRFVPRSESLDWISRHRGRRRNLGQKLAIGEAEPKLAVGLSIHLIAFLVHRTMMPATE